MVVSLTTTPMMCARLLRRTTAGGARALRPLERRPLIEKLLAGYVRSLRWALRHRRLVLCILLGTVGLNLVLFGSMRKGFFPLEDTGILAGSLQAEQSISPQRLVTKLKQYVQIMSADPAIATVVGVTGNGGANTAQLSIRLKPLAERKISSEAVIARLRPQLAHVAGATLFLRSIQSLGGGGGAQQGNSLYQYSLQADDLTAVKVWTDKLVTALKSEPLLLDVNSDQQDKGLTTELAIDRDTASRLGSHFRSGRQHALRRFRPAPRVHDLQVAQPVSRRHGGAAPVSGESRHLAGHLCQCRRRSHHRDAGVQCHLGHRPGRECQCREFVRDRGRHRPQCRTQFHRDHRQGLRPRRRRRSAPPVRG